jgi:cellulose synthase/poly-beta-1,6-N-acetylglucosamine synthase-like glycosyltransferase
MMNEADDLPMAMMSDHASGGTNGMMGNLLLAKGLLSKEQLQEALQLQQRWGTRLGDILLAKGWVRAIDFYHTLADHLGKEYVDLFREPLDGQLLSNGDLSHYTELLVLPWRVVNGRVIVALADPGEAALSYIRERYGSETDYVITSKFDIIWMVQRHADKYLDTMARFALSERDPEHSAQTVFSVKQLVGVYLLLSLVLLSIALWPVNTLIALNLLISLGLLLNFGFRALLVWVAADARIDVKVSDEEVAALTEDELPTYTVLVPMYKEPEVLPIITAAIRNFDYPLSRLDIKLILEEDDHLTIDTAKGLGLEGIFEIIRVPPSQPRTKPKACNYALQFARGEYVTIYDAEDRPEPDQLKKVVAAFRKASDNTVVIQARLNYFNAEENWLTRMFTLEYSLWFDFYLPALDALNIPVPLGGTSNHFKLEALRQVEAWDPYNVTEDADLGVRFTGLNYHVGLVNSTTYEEANSRLGSWIKQRSRWHKGYMQTYLVHMRHPLDLYRSLGHVGFWGFQFFIGGTIASVLIAPLLWGIFIAWLLTGTHEFDQIFPPLVLYVSTFNLMLGNGLLIYLSSFSVFKRRLYRLIPYSLFSPFYWLLMSWAAFKALWQLVHAPFYWEKTQHGVSRFNQEGAVGKIEQVGKR